MISVDSTSFLQGAIVGYLSRMSPVRGRYAPKVTIIKILVNMATGQIVAVNQPPSSHSRATSIHGTRRVGYWFM